jgi:hypothetical protein
MAKRLRESGTSVARAHEIGAVVPSEIIQIEFREQIDRQADSSGLVLGCGEMDRVFRRKVAVDFAQRPLPHAPRPFCVAEYSFDGRRTVPDEEARLITRPHDDFKITRNALSSLLQRPIVRQPILDAGQGYCEPEAQRLLLDWVSEEVLQAFHRIVALERFPVSFD